MDFEQSIVLDAGSMHYRPMSQSAVPAMRGCQRRCCVECQTCFVMLVKIAGKDTETVNGGHFSPEGSISHVRRQNSMPSPSGSTTVQGNSKLRYTG
jgi:hypothetical protein